MDTRYTMRLAAPLDAEEIPAFAERLADIINGDRSKLETLLARGTKGLIRATSREEAEKVASVFRRAGLDVEVVTREQAAAAPPPVTAAAPDPVPVEAAAVEPTPEPDSAFEATPEPVAPIEDTPRSPVAASDDTESESAAAEIAESEPPEPLFSESEQLEPDLSEPEITEPDLSGGAVPADPLGASAESSGDPPESAAAATDIDPAFTPLPPDITRFDGRVDEPISSEERRSMAPLAEPAPAVRLFGLVGALLLIIGPFLGQAADGIAVDLSDLGGSPYGVIMVVLGLVSLLPIVLGRIRWLWFSVVAVLLAWGWAVVDSGRIGDLGTLIAQWAWLLFPLGAVLMLIAVVMPTER